MKKLPILLLIFVLASALSGRAQVVQFANRTLYNTATGNNTVIDFTGQQHALSSSISLGGVTFSGVGSVAGTPITVEIIDGTNDGQSGNNVLTTNNANFLQDSLRIDLPVGTTGFATDFKAATNSITAPPETFQFTLFSGATNLGSFLAPSLTGNGLSFVGFSSPSSPITAVQVQATGAIGSPVAVLDNVTFTAAAVPEPSPVALLTFAGASLAAIKMLRQRRRQG